jgi:hypothetical protein
MTVTEVTYGAVSFSGVNLPFSITDLIGTAMNFLGLYGQWVLLGLAVIFMPVLIGFLMNLVSRAKKSSTK